MDRIDDSIALGALNLLMALTLTAIFWGFEVFWYAALLATPVMLGILIRIAYAGDNVASSPAEGSS